MHILIEDHQVLEAYSNQCRKDCFITEDPFVYESLMRKGQNVVSMSSILTRQKVQVISHLAAVLSQHWVETINRYYQSTLPYYSEVGRAINTVLYNLLSTAFYKFEVLCALRDRGVVATLPVHDFEEPNHTLLGFQNNKLLRELCELDELKGCFHCVVIGRLDEGMRERPYEVVHRKGMQYWKLYALGICADPTRFLYHVLAPFFSAQNPVRDVMHKKERVSVLILQGGPQITVLILPLLLKGIRFYNLKFEKAPNEIYAAGCADEELKSVLVKTCLDCEGYKNLANNSSLIELLAHKISVYTNGYVVPVLTHFWGKLNRDLRGKEGKRKLVLFAGTRDPVSSVIGDIFANFGIPTIAFQEGTSCLLKLYRDLASVGYITWGHAFVSRAPHEEKYFKKVTNMSSKPFFCLGMEEIQRAHFPGLSRKLARKVWNIASDKKVILYLPTKYHGKVIRPYWDFLDIEYWKYQKRLILNVLGKSRKSVYIKIHKKGLISTDDTRMHPINALDLPENIVLKESPDMRFTRFCADLIIIDRATSTIAWAVTSDTPVVYVNNEDAPLEDEVREAMKNSLFVIDVKEDNNWEDELLTLIRQPVKKIRKQWGKMSDKRGRFLRQYVTGCRRSKKEFYDWIKLISNIETKKLIEMNRVINTDAPGK